VPTLVRRFPGPLRRIVGDLSSAAWIRHSLGPAEVSDGQPGLDE
jgi:KaiB domain